MPLIHLVSLTLPYKALISLFAAVIHPRSICISDHVHTDLSTIKISRMALANPCTSVGVSQSSRLCLAMRQVSLCQRRHGLYFGLIRHIHAERKDLRLGVSRQELGRPVLIRRSHSFDLVKFLLELLRSDCLRVSAFLQSESLTLQCL
jgi:hypothetical protein